MKKHNIAKLHVGCGRIFIPGFLHIDIQPAPHVDIVTEADALDMIPDQSVELIYACHILEHFDRWRYKGALEEWFRVLRPQGVLRLAVPDFQSCVEVYSKVGLASGPESILGLVCGGQRDPFDFHKMIFDRRMLTRVLLEIGFSEVREWDWRSTDHAKIDDYSQAYLPHLDKTNGKHMSLNLEAVK
ncbi:MAG: methyltransferase domain-containing protein [Rhodobacteraceae bacterium]|nr:methyltransferase domain-containing protein [Paracoccaceae bacterium]